MYVQDIDRCDASIERAHKNGIIILGSYGEHDSSLFINFTLAPEDCTLGNIDPKTFKNLRLISRKEDTWSRSFWIKDVGCEVTYVDYPPDEHFIACGCYDGSVTLYKPSTYRRRCGRIPSGTYRESLHYFVFSPDKQYILSGSEDGTIYNYTFTGKNKLFKFELSQSSDPGVNSICFYPNGRYALSGSLAAKTVLFVFGIHRRGKWGRSL